MNAPEAVSMCKDPRAWIQKILDRKARGDPTLSPLAYQKALEAQAVRPLPTKGRK